MLFRFGLVQCIVKKNMVVAHIAMLPFPVVARHMTRERNAEVRNKAGPSAKA
jgi:hypothetical protein